MKYSFVDMKDKPKFELETKPAETELPLRVEVSERLSDVDKLTFHLAKMKREMELASARSIAELAEAQYEVSILRLAVTYKLANGDTIKDDGSIERKAI